jgi:hypothetical protein
VKNDHSAVSKNSPPKTAILSSDLPSSMCDLQLRR